MTSTDAARALRPPFAPSPAADSGGRPPRPRTGPVLMGDIHGARAGRPDLLLLWAQWEDAARDDGE